MKNPKRICLSVTRGSDAMLAVIGAVQQIVACMPDGLCGSDVCVLACDRSAEGAMRGLLLRAFGCEGFDGFVVRAAGEDEHHDQQGERRGMCGSDPGVGVGSSLHGAFP
jgi:hypothetical protein